MLLVIQKYWDTPISASKLVSLWTHVLNWIFYKTFNLGRLIHRVRLQKRYQKCIPYSLNQFIFVYLCIYSFINLFFILQISYVFISCWKFVPLLGSFLLWESLETLTLSWRRFALQISRLIYIYIYIDLRHERVKSFLTLKFSHISNITQKIMVKFFWATF